MTRLTATAPNGRVFTRYSEFYSAKHNAVRAARRHLGRDAVPGREFTVERTTKGWTWYGKGNGFEDAAVVVSPAVSAAPVPAAAHAPAKAGDAASILGLLQPVGPNPLDSAAFQDVLRRIAVENGLYVVQAVMQALAVPQKVA
jgi:hypothetical protein